MELTPRIKVKEEVLEMEIVVHSLVCMYGLLTLVAGVVQWKEKGFSIRSLLFVLTSLALVVSSFIPNWTLYLIVVCFISLHLLAIWEGIQTKGRISYSHHGFRFVFHMLIVIGVIL